jgi:hypothetical protein
VCGNYQEEVVGGMEVKEAAVGSIDAAAAPESWSCLLPRDSFSWLSTVGQEKPSQLVGKGLTGSKRPTAVGCR